MLDKLYNNRSISAREAYSRLRNMVVAETDVFDPTMLMEYTQIHSNDQKALTRLLQELEELDRDRERREPSPRTKPPKKQIHTTQ